MKPTNPFARLLALALLLVLAPTGAFAQTTDTTGVEAADVDLELEASATANAEARDAFTAAVEAAQAANAQGTAVGYVEAGEQYAEAYEIAAASGDAELEARSAAVLENATKAYVDAGSAYSEAEAFGDAAAQFERAAELAGQAGDAELQAKTLYNAAVAQVSAEDFARAVELLDEAITLSPDDLNYYYVRGVAQGQAGDAEGSAATLTALEARADSLGDEAMATRARQTLGRTHLIAARDAIQAERYSDAIAALDKAAPYLGEDDASLNTFYANAYYRLGVGQVQAENYGAAQRSLEQAQTYARRAGRDNIVTGAQAQLDYIREIRASQG